METVINALKNSTATLDQKIAKMNAIAAKMKSMGATDNMCDDFKFAVMFAIDSKFAQAVSDMSWEQQAS